MNVVDRIFPSYEYEITTPQTLCTNDSCKLTYRIYCNEGLYNNFKQNHHSNWKVSKYNLFKPIIHVYGKKKHIEKVKN